MVKQIKINLDLFSKVLTVCKENNIDLRPAPKISKHKIYKSAEFKSINNYSNSRGISI